MRYDQLFTKTLLTAILTSMVMSVSASNKRDSLNILNRIYNYQQASKRFQEAIDEIDKSIAHLQKIKDALTASDRQLRLANDKAEDLSIKKRMRTITTSPTSCCQAPSVITARHSLPCSTT